LHGLGRTRLVAEKRRRGRGAGSAGGLEAGGVALLVGGDQRGGGLAAVTLEGLALSFLGGDPDEGAGVEKQVGSADDLSTYVGCADWSWGS
jgi:hypothetical protein